MFNCYNHGWSHLEKLCPQCFPVHYTTRDSTGPMETRIDHKLKWYVAKIEDEKERYRKALEWIAAGNIAPSSTKERYLDETYQRIALEALKGK